MLHHLKIGANWGLRGKVFAPGSVVLLKDDYSLGGTAEGGVLNTECERFPDNLIKRINSYIILGRDSLSEEIHYYLVSVNTMYDEYIDNGEDPYGWVRVPETLLRTTNDPGDRFEPFTAQTVDDFSTGPRKLIRAKNLQNFIQEERIEHQCFDVIKGSHSFHVRGRDLDGLFD